MFGLLQVLQRHRVTVRRLFRNAALALDVGLSVIIFYRLLEFTRFRRTLIDTLHPAIRDLVRSLGADGLARCLDYALCGFVWSNLFLLESFTFAATHKFPLKLSTNEKRLRELCYFELGDDVAAVYFKGLFFIAAH